ncbi:MAG: hypothetical protein Ta2F_09820 [Termitinemataceae bacterium]|nr:MAG: hypothetical protein Ta2F_09820 [Termitinemataceae bacterium]
MTLAGCKGGSIDEITAGGGGGGSSARGQTGLFFTFAGGGGTPTIQSINLTAPSAVANPIFSTGVEDEADFFAQLVDLGKYETMPETYDYASDPKAVGPNAENPGDVLYTLGEDKQHYTLVETPSEPFRNGYDFAGWEITAIEAPFNEVFTVSTGATPRFLDLGSIGTGITVSTTLAKKSKAYLALTAKWQLNGKIAEEADELTKKIKEMEDKAKTGSSGSGYADEYVIGKPATGDQLVAFAAAIAEAEEAVLGDLKTETVEISGEYCQDNEGNFTDQAGIPLTQIDDETYSGGGNTYNRSELPLPAVATFQYREISADKLEAALAALEAFNDVDVSGYIKGSTNIPADKKHHSVTIATTGVYEIELNGASGGATMGREYMNGMDDAGNSPSLGGYGGYVKGEVSLQAGDVLHFRAGSAGTGTATYSNGTFTKNTMTYSVQQAGGWPNGGIGGKGAGVWPSGASGGGSTDVFFVGNGADKAATYDETTKAWTAATLPTDLNKRFMVAAGGGGGCQSIGVNVSNGKSLYPAFAGGSAGKPGLLTGFNAAAGTALADDPTYGAKVYSYTDKADTRRYWGVVNTNVNLNGGKTYYNDLRSGIATDEFGINGGAGYTSGSSAEGCGGGGGGWRGGGAVNDYRRNDPSGVFHTGTGAGGSNYIHTTTTGNFVNTGSTAGKTVTDKTGTSATYISAIYGDGSAKITFVSE